MTNKKKKIAQIIAIILGFLMILSIIPYQAFAQAPRDGISSEMANALDNAENLINKAQQEPTDDNVNKAIDGFIVPSIYIDSKIQHIGKYVAGLRDKLTDTIDKLPTDRKYNFFESMIIKSFATNSYFKDNYGKGLFIKYADLRTRPNLVQYWDKIKRLEDVVDAIATTDPVYSGEIDDKMIGVTDEMRNQFKPEGKKDNKNNTAEYKLKNGGCYQVVYNYKNGQLVNTSEVKVNNLYCALMDGSNLSSSTNNSSYDSTSVLLNELYNQKKNESNITLQYSLNKQDDYASYYDSGIRVSLTNTITYSQVKDVMYQVTTKNNGQFIEDGDKFMSLIENKLFIMENTKKDIAVKDFERMFEVFKKVEVKALDTKIGTVCSLTDYLEIKRINNVVFDKNKISLDNPPIIKDNIALFPVQEFAKLLGADAKIEDTKVTVTKGLNKIVFEEGKDTINVNSMNISVKVACKKNSKGILMAQIQPMIEKLGHDMVWDSESTTLTISKK